MDYSCKLVCREEGFIDFKSEVEWMSMCEKTDKNDKEHDEE